MRCIENGREGGVHIDESALLVRPCFFALEVEASRARSLTRAPYPARSTAPISACAGVSPPHVTSACPVAKLTCTPVTPGTRPSTFSTRPTHAAQCMPWMRRGTSAMNEARHAQGARQPPVRRATLAANSESA